MCVFYWRQIMRAHELTMSKCGLYWVQWYLWKYDPNYENWGLGHLPSLYELVNVNCEWGL